MVVITGHLLPVSQFHDGQVSRAGTAYPLGSTLPTPMNVLLVDLIVIKHQTEVLAGEQFLAGPLHQQGFMCMLTNTIFNGGMVVVN